MSRSTNYTLNGLDCIFCSQPMTLFNYLWGSDASCENCFVTYWTDTEFKIDVIEFLRSFDSKSFPYTIVIKSINNSFSLILGITDLNNTSPDRIQTIIFPLDWIFPHQILDHLLRYKNLLMFL